MSAATRAIWEWLGAPEWGPPAADTMRPTGGGGEQADG